MASISIFPLSFSGVQAPLNLLDQFLGGNQISYNNLLYPMDLASNPAYSHAVQFTIKNYEYPQIEAAYNQIQSAITNAVNSGAAATSGAFASGSAALQTAQNQSLQQNVAAITSAVKGSLSSIAGGASAIAGNISGITPEQVQQFITQYGTAFQYSNFQGYTTNTLATVSLYMPDTLMTNFESDYTSISLTSTFGLAGYISNALADKKFAGGVSHLDIGTILNTAAGKNAAASAIGGILGGEAAVGLFQNALKQVPNPQLQLIYKGIGLREFQFEFIFTPTSTQEAEAVDQIIKTFEYYSLPNIVGADSNSQFLEPPQVFSIQFHYTGDAGITGLVSNVLQNTLTNVLGTQLSAFTSPSQQSQKISSGNSAKVFDMGDCVLSNVMVDYAPNGWAAYQDGYPVQTRMTLQFKEMKIRTKADVPLKGKPPSAPSSPPPQGATTSPIDLSNATVPFNSKVTVNGSPSSIPGSL
jgi:hypothetical protein